MISGINSWSYESPCIKWTHVYLPLLSAIKKAFTFVKDTLIRKDSRYFTATTVWDVSASTTAGTPSSEDQWLLVTAFLYSHTHLQTAKITNTCVENVTTSFPNCLAEARPMQYSILASSCHKKWTKLTD